MSHRKIKLKLFNENPNCHWCGELTVLTNEPSLNKSNINPKMATVDHIISRLHVERWVKRGPDERRKVLACYECNQRRAMEEESKLSKEELMRRCHGFALNKAPDGKTIIQSTMDSVETVIDTLKKFGNIPNGETKSHKTNL